MSDDLLSVLTGGQESLTPAQPAQAQSVDPTDYLVRTVYGEADPGSTDSRQAVASVIVNRAKKSGKSFDQVVQEPGQFEPWSDPKARARMLALDPNSADYKQILSDVQPVIKGDVSLPYESFYSPSVLKARGQDKPAFDDGSGKQIGSQLFFAGGGQPDLGYILGGGAADDKAAEAAYQTAFGGPGAAASPDAAKGPATIAMKDGKIVFGDTLQPVPGPQAKTIQTLAKGGWFSQDAQPGSVNAPWVQRNPTDQFKPGEFYIEAGPEGLLKQVPGGPKVANGGFTGGFQAGLGDVANSLFKIIPGHDNSDIYNANEANRLIYDATHQGDTFAQAGRLTGQLAGSAPLLLGGEGAIGALASRAPEAAAPALDFLAGKAGGNLAIRGGSLVARGALEGGGAGLLTSGSSDEPVLQQMLHGAEAGAILNPLLPGASAALDKAGSVLFGGANVSPEVANLADLAVNKYGIPLRTTQIRGTADRNAAIADSEMIGRAGTGYADNQALQRQAFTKAVAGTFGEDADKLTPDVMSRAKARIGSEFDRVAQATNITDTNSLISKLDGVVSEASQVLPNSDLSPIANLTENIKSAIKNGTLSGESYQALTRKGSPLERATDKGNPNIRQYAQDLEGVLQDALSSAASPEDQAALTNAKFQYKNLMTVKNLAAKAGVSGEISPSLLNGAVNTSFKNRAFSGAGDLGELAQIGQTFMKEPGNSNTAPRIAARLKDFALGAGGLGEGLLLFHDPGTALKLGGAAAAAGAANLVKNAAMGARNRSPQAVNKLIQRSASGVPAPSVLQGAGPIIRPAVIPAGAIITNNLMPQPSAAR